MDSQRQRIIENKDDDSSDLYFLKPVWLKHMMGAKPGFENTEVETALLNLLGVGLLPTYAFLYGHRPDFEAFKNWVRSHHGGKVPGEILQQCINLVERRPVNPAALNEEVLSAGDLEFFREQGYVIIKNAVSKEDCARAKEAICSFLGVDEKDASTWYTSSEKLQGIMVNLYRHPALDKNRQAPRIRRAFEQVWERTDLIVTTDKVGFNPPETENHKYRGIGLHWDISLSLPIPFGVQGILYLTDTLAHGGHSPWCPAFIEK